MGEFETVMQTRDEVENNFPEKKSKTLLFRALIEREILTSREVLHTKHACTRNQSLFCKNDAFQNMGFSRLKCQLKRKKIDAGCL